MTITTAPLPAAREIPPLRRIVHGPITFVSHCERHGMPFFGRACVGYVRTSERLGPAMLRRMVLQASIRPAGVALSVRSAHDCGGQRLLDDDRAAGRASWRGRCKADRRLRAEFLARCVT